jgi:hypothetical protein
MCFRLHIWVRSCDICLYVSGLLHLTQCLPGSSMLSQMTGFHPLLMAEPYFIVSETSHWTEASAKKNVQSFHWRALSPSGQGPQTDPTCSGRSVWGPHCSFLIFFVLVCGSCFVLWQLRSNTKLGKLLPLSYIPALLCSSDALVLLWLSLQVAVHDLDLVLPWSHLSHTAKTCGKTYKNESWCQRGWCKSSTSDVNVIIANY